MKEWLVAVEKSDYFASNDYRFFESLEEATKFKNEYFNKGLQKIREGSNYNLVDYNDFDYVSYILYGNASGKKKLTWRIIHVE